MAFLRLFILFEIQPRNLVKINFWTKSKFFLALLYMNDISWRFQVGLVSKTLSVFEIQPGNIVKINFWTKSKFFLALLYMNDIPWRFQVGLIYKTLSAGTTKSSFFSGFSPSSRYSRETLSKLIFGPNQSFFLHFYIWMTYPEDFKWGSSIKHSLPALRSLRFSPAFHPLRDTAGKPCQN